LFFAPSRLCVFLVIVFWRKGAETRRVLPISIFASFALLHIQLTITEITGFPDSAVWVVGNQGEPTGASHGDEIIYYFLKSSAVEQE